MIKKEKENVSSLTVTRKRRSMLRKKKKKKKNEEEQQQTTTTNSPMTLKLDQGHRYRCERVTYSRGCHHAGFFKKISLKHPTKPTNSFFNKVKKQTKNSPHTLQLSPLNTHRNHAKLSVHNLVQVCNNWAKVQFQ